MANRHLRMRAAGVCIFTGMSLPSPARAAVATLAAMILVPALAAASSSASKASVSKRALGKSSQLWATIDVCNPTDHPDELGVRGSMPGNGQSGVAMYMRFRLQYLNSSTKHWVDLANGATSFKNIGTAKSARQYGTSFQLVPQPGRTFTLRGVVTFQWRRGATVLESLSRPTTRGHRSLAGADPPNFSAATCSIS